MSRQPDWVIGSTEPPPADVVAAFGADPGALVRLPSGRGRTWRSGRVVLRPSGDPEEAAWKADVLATLGRHAGFLTTLPVRDADGRWVRDGWEAWEWVPGTPDESRVPDVVRAGAAFHRAVAGLPRPAFIGRTDDAWSRADRMVWGEEPLPADPLLSELSAMFEPVSLPAQLIHGDLLGNVLFAPGQQPVIIDWAPYWRPAGLGAAIAAVDAACWHGWPPSRLQASDFPDATADWPQLLLRAVAFRIATSQLLGRWTDRLAERHAPVIEAVVAMR